MFVYQHRGAGTPRHSQEADKSQKNDSRNGRTRRCFDQKQFPYGRTPHKPINQGTIPAHHTMAHEAPI